MRNNRWIVLPFLLLFLLGCGLFSGVQSIKNAVTTQLPDIQNAVSTQLPALLTSVPTAQGLIETFAATQFPSNCGTPTSGGLGIELGRAKTVLQATQQFTFTDGTIDGQPASTATLASAGASAFSAISDGFSAQFIGDPCNLSRILITAPYTDQQATVDQGVAAASLLFSTLMPLDAQLPLLAWLTENYAKVPVSGQQQTTIKNMQFTLSRTQTEMTLDIVPAK
jgi:hypothetical protein